MRLTMTLLSLALLCAGCQTRPDVKDPASPTHATPQEILELALTRALIDRELPDYGLLGNPKKVVLSDSHLNREWVPVLPGVELVVMSEEQIAATANENGDFLFVYVSDLDVGTGNMASVRVQSVWARSADSTVTYVSGGGFTVTYERDGDKWVEANSVSWIS